MKKLILNADDFGLTRGVNEGIIRAHREGILTSATLMASAPLSIMPSSSRNRIPAWASAATWFSLAETAVRQPKKFQHSPMQRWPIPGFAGVFRRATSAPEESDPRKSNGNYAHKF